MFFRPARLASSFRTGNRPAPRGTAIRSGIVVVMIGAAALCGSAGTARADPTDGGLGPDPNKAAQYWGRQTYDDCALMAAADVVGELTGSKPSEPEIIALATSTPSGHSGGPIYTLPRDLDNPDPADEVHAADLPILLAHYGVASVFANDSTAAAGGPPTGMPALEDDLNAGKKVIASLNGETIWDKPGDRTVHDHALVVTGVDVGTGTVHLNDSAARGPDSQVSFGTFEAAWKTSNHTMVVAG